MGKRRSPQYPCGVCRTDCAEGRVVMCGTCEYWFHEKCEHLTPLQFRSLSNLEEEFLCTSCTHANGEFDFYAATNRLGKAAKKGIKKLRTAVQMETILLRRVDQTFPSTETWFTDHTEDSTTVQIMKKMGGTKEVKPAAVTPDGNCLFNALSVYIFGDECVAAKIRTLTTIEIVTYYSDYQHQLEARDIHLVSPDYEEACLACATPGSYSSAWTMQAAASVIGRDVLSTFPPVNGLLDRCVKILDTIFKPRITDTAAGPAIQIMWTSVSLPSPSRIWTPNHFVPLLPVRPSEIISISFDDQTPPLELLSPSISPILSDDPIFTYDRDEALGSSDIPVASSPKACEVASDHAADDFDKLPTEGSFLTLPVLLQLSSNPSNLRQSIPLGSKDNVYNSNKPAKTRSDFPDDCGVWDTKKGTTVNIYIYIDSLGNSKTVYLKNGSYCTESRRKGKSTYIPLEPQPDEDSIVNLHRYYTTLKEDNSYKKRVTCFRRPGHAHVAIIEYCGKMPSTPSTHGNAKQCKPYLRTDRKILSKIGEAVRNKAPREVYQEMLNNSAEAPRDFKQVRDKKYKDQKKERQHHRVNVADEVLAVISMLDDNPHVQEIIHKKNKPPCVILYSDEQLHDMKSNLNSGSVLGVDRTFNLGACYVTTTVYKNHFVNHKESGDFPLFLGPVFLHWDAEFVTYHSFFSHLKSVLFDCIEGFELKIGSDQEAALMKALKSCFPDASYLLCTKHLKDNVTRYLSDKVGCSVSERNSIFKCIFGEFGLVNSSDLYVFEKRALDVMLLAENYPLFRNYFEKLKPVLLNYVTEPRQRGVTDKLWTNNNCESLNNILKLSTNWKPQKLPDLVEKLCDLTKLQMLDLRRSLYGTGNYVLLSKFKKYSVSRDVWVKKSEEEKCKIFLDFICRKKCSRVNKIYATDVDFVIPHTTRIAKKPYQRKRAKSERAK